MAGLVAMSAQSLMLSAAKTPTSWSRSLCGGCPASSSASQVTSRMRRCWGLTLSASAGEILEEERVEAVRVLQEPAVLHVHLGVRLGVRVVEHAHVPAVRGKLARAGLARAEELPVLLGVVTTRRESGRPCRRPRWARCAAASSSSSLARSVRPRAARVARGRGRRPRLSTVWTATPSGSFSTPARRCGRECRSAPANSCPDR